MSKVTMKCAWCDKEVHVDRIVNYPLPDDDYVEICNECFFGEEKKQMARFETPRMRAMEKVHV